MSRFARRPRLRSLRARVGRRRPIWLRVAALFPSLTALLAAGPPTTCAQGWGAEERVTSTSTDSETGLSRSPLAVDSRGNLHVVWSEQDGPSANYQIHSRRRLIAGWDTSRKAVAYLASYPGSGLGAKYPSLVVDPEDSLHMTWHDYRIAGIQNAEIFFKSRGIDAQWDTTGASEVRLTTTSHPETNGDNGYLPSLVQNGVGLLAVVWYDYRFDGNNAEIHFKARSGGVWDLTPGDAADFRVSETAGNSTDPAVAVDSAGNTHVVWADQVAGGVILYRRRSAAGSWGAVETVNTGANAIGSPAAAVDPCGTLHVAWVDAREGSQVILARSRSEGGTWGAETRIGPGGKNAQEPALAADTDGTLYAAWHDTRVSLLNREVFLQSRAPGGAWDSTGALDFRVSTGSGHSTRPSLLVDRFRNLHVLWKDRRDGNAEIYYRVWRNPALTGVEPPAADGEAAARVDGTDPLQARVHPNPTRGQATVRVSVSRSGPLEIRVYDVAGREVRALWEGFARPGEIARAWDGRDSRGGALPAGVYLLRATLGSERTTARLVLLPHGGS